MAIKTATGIPSNAMNDGGEDGERMFDYRCRTIPLPDNSLCLISCQTRMTSFYETQLERARLRRPLGVSSVP